jgi:3-hydroxybutyrate dehydrogenase
MLNGKCALVTGSIGGLGYAIAEALAGQGCSIVLNDITPAAGAATAQDALRAKFGVDALYVQADLADSTQIARMIAAAAERFGAVDIVVNNAVVRHFQPVERLSPDDWNESLAVNLSAPFHIIRLTLPMMRQRGWGRIFNLSSYYGFRGAENRIGYVTTKTALLGMTRAVALEVESDGADITCNAICPGTLATPDIIRRVEKMAVAQGMSEAEATRAYLAGRRPSGRFVGAESVAATITFLCGPAGRDINGAALPVDGGWLAT